jgi:hypothetical protein
MERQALAGHVDQFRERGGVLLSGGAAGRLDHADFLFLVTLL